MKKYMKMISAIFIVLMIVVISNQAYAITCPYCGGYAGTACPRCGGSGEIAGSTHTTDDIISGAEGFIQKGEANANDLIGSRHTDPYSGYPGFKSSRCKIRKISF